MSSSGIVVFRLDECRYGLLLAAVERVVRLVEITRLPKAPDIVLGVVNVQGEVVPIVDVRARFGLAERSAELTDQLIVARTAARRLALHVDSVEGVSHYAEDQLVPAEAVVPGTEYLAGVVKSSDGLVLIHDLDRFLSLDEARHLDEAVSDG